MLIGQICITLLFAIALILSAGLSYLEDNYGQISVAQLIYHLHTDNTGTDWASFSDLFHEIGVRCVFALVISAGIFIIFLRLRKETDNRKLRRNMITISIARLLLCVFSIGLIGKVFSEFDEVYGLEDYLISQKMSSTLYEDYYVNASDAVITTPDSKKNLIYIFLESMETTAADMASGGANSVNVIPELTELALQNTCFNGTSDTLNGALVMGATGWTIAGMVAQTSGTPLATPIGGNDYGAESFLPGVTSIGEVLEKEGYHNYLMIGSDASFANRKAYFEQHGNYEILDYYWAMEYKYDLLGEGYPVWWGYEDAKLFEFAETQLLELAQQGEPFNFTMLTVDTHTQDGYVCEDCGDSYEDQYSNVFACSSKKVSEFVAWVQQQEFAEDTVIVICGDHLTMNADYYANIDSEYNRRTYVSIINADKDEPENARLYCTMDMFPTTLSAMGFEIEGDRLGLGTDLYSNTPTLLELLGEDQFAGELALNSKYFNSELLYCEE
jgi:phosphoglycerol transferase